MTTSAAPRPRGGQTRLSLDDPNLTKQQLYSLRCRLKKKAQATNEPVKQMSIDDEGLSRKQITDLKYRIRNTEKIAQSKKTWKEKNAEHVKQYNHNYYENHKKAKEPKPPMFIPVEDK